MFILLALLITMLMMGYLMQRRHTRQQKQALIRKLYAWADQAPVLDPDLHQWIYRLPAAEASVLVNLLAGYCASLNWELNWIFMPQIERAPVLKQAIEESISAYARAILTALQLERDVHAYHTYVAFAQKPTAGKHRNLVKKLYPKIEAAGIITPDEPTHAWRLLPKRSASGSEKNRKKPPSHKEQIEYIQLAFEQDPLRTMELLKQVLAADASDIVTAVSQEQQNMDPQIA